MSAALLAAALGFGFALDCTLTTIGLTPLNDLGPGSYLPGVSGGLYPGGQSSRPGLHEAAGLAIAQTEVLPRDASGAIDLVSGKIGLISIGMSNTSLEFSGGPWAFKARADADPSKDGRLVIVNGAQGGYSADEWADPAAPTWAVLATRIANAGLVPEQVQVLWMKHAEAGDGVSLGSYPANVDALETHLVDILHTVTASYPNLRLAYLSSRARSYNPTHEPWAYEGGLAVRGVIGRQLAGDSSLSHQQPGATAPWLAWGPYLWADGLQPRSDGFTWDCADLNTDFVHPSMSGETKVADQLLAFFKTDPTSVPWYLRATPVGSAPQVSVTASSLSGPAPLSVDLHADATDNDGVVTELAWTYDDGGFAYGTDVTKVFPVPGDYDVQLTVSDDDGDTTRVTTTITVTGGGGSVSLAPVADAYVRDGGLANSNFGTAPTLAVHAGPVGQVARSFLRFDLGSAPAGCTGASLALFCNALGPGATPSLSVAPVADDSWTELGLTWNSQPALGASSVGVPVGAVGQSYDFDVSVPAALALAGDGVLSLALIDPGAGGPLVGFDSREGGLPPVLLLTCGASPWSDLGNGLAGVSGLPQLLGVGPLTGGTQAALVVTSAAPSAATTLVLGFSQLGAALKGGVLVPTPDVIAGGLLTTTDGDATIGTLWPVGVPSGVTFIVQAWIVDALGPKGVSASNGLRAVTP